MGGLAAWLPNPWLGWRSLQWCWPLTFCRDGVGDSDGGGDGADCDGDGDDYGDVHVGLEAWFPIAG